MKNLQTQSAGNSSKTNTRRKPGTITIMPHVTGIGMFSWGGGRATTIALPPVCIRGLHANVEPGGIVTLYSMKFAFARVMSPGGDLGKQNPGFS